MTQIARPAPLAGPEVVIAGAGLGGLAAGIFLRQAGLRVVCIEPEPFPHARVGESLDWSAPGLLAALGLPRDTLVRDQIATYKRNIKVVPLGKPAFYGEPPEGLREPPWRFEIMTLHVDREQLDQRLFARACTVGVTFLWDRVTGLETRGTRVVACQTARHGRISAPWFIDGSGQAQVFTKALRLSRVEYGRRKVCLWTYFQTPPAGQTTTLYGDNADAYLTWIWEIPVTPTTTSVGCIMAADTFKSRRQKGEPPAAVLRAELARHPRFAPLLQAQPTTPLRTCSYHSYVNRTVCGPNWLLVGEAASLPDPLTANGVTAAFRHGQEAALLIAQARGRGALSTRQQRVYTTNLRRMGHAFNHNIETTAYDWPARWVLGEQRALNVYTNFSYLVNVLYSRYRPQSRRALAAFGLLFAGVRVWIDGWALGSRLVYAIRRRRPRGSPAGGRARPIPHAHEV